MFATLLAGSPRENPALFHRVRFETGDPAAWIHIHSPNQPCSLFIVRDIELERARASVRVDQVHCPADFSPPGGLSGDRATATAQAVAECLSRHHVARVDADRTLPWIFAWYIQQAGIAVEYDPDLGVLDRRSKDDQEIQWLQAAQSATEQVMLRACQTIAHAVADAKGQLQHAGSLLTCQRMKRMITQWLLDLEFQCPHGMIVATSPQSADCHASGSGPLWTGQPVILDIFPRSTQTHYHGDCTRTVVHGECSDTVRNMHAAVIAAKHAATAQAIAGATADAVHGTTLAQLELHGFRFARGQMADDPIMPHGTGHGIGLEVHEPILLDERGGTLMAGEVLTIEPGLYSRLHGGVRVEDMIVVAETGPPRNLNCLPEGLDWR
ncbi:MAG: aminopeptidase P family protein [Pirellulaceae bacterium]|nr:aminopeptidase P family protein [Pirellulaceae bacterium]